MVVSEINGGNSTTINSDGQQISSASGSSSNNETITVTDGENTMLPPNQIPSQTTNITNPINHFSPAIVVKPIVQKPLAPPQPIVVLDDTHNKVSLANQQGNLAAAAAVTKPNQSINIKAYPLPSPSSALRSGAQINNLLSKLDNQLKNSGISPSQQSKPTINLSKAMPTASLLPISLSF